MQIAKKVWPEYFEHILDGSKKFELRLNDFKCETGDILVLKEWNPKTRRFTGREVKREAGYIFRFKPNDSKLHKFWPKEEIEKYGFQVISFK